MTNNEATEARIPKGTPVRAKWTIGANGAGFIQVDQTPCLDLWKVVGHGIDADQYWIEPYNGGAWCAILRNQFIPIDSKLDKAHGEALFINAGLTAYRAHYDHQHLSNAQVIDHIEWHQIRCF